jgi:hypothetical protein
VCILLIQERDIRKHCVFNTQYIFPYVEIKNSQKFLNVGRNGQKTGENGEEFEKKMGKKTFDYQQ